MRYLGHNNNNQKIMFCCCFKDSVLLNSATILYSASLKKAVLSAVDTEGLHLLKNFNFTWRIGHHICQHLRHWKVWATTNKLGFKEQSLPTLPSACPRRSSRPEVPPCEPLTDQTTRETSMVPEGC